MTPQKKVLSGALQNQPTDLPLTSRGRGVVPISCLRDIAMRTMEGWSGTEAQFDLVRCIGAPSHTSLHASGLKDIQKCLGLRRSLPEQTVSSLPPGFHRGR